MIAATLHEKILKTLIKDVFSKKCNLNFGHYIQKIYVWYKHEETWRIVQPLNKII